jgi:hypothetical protein
MIPKTESLLFGTRTLLNQQDKIRIIKGESFNIFSILKMERLEVRTHSAFIGELLNPKGSHQKGNLFLDIFLQELKLDHLDINSCTVKIECSIGPIDIEKKTGGRIDILIQDKWNKSVCIENKIDAGDQSAQVQRYCNYNQPKNKVFYLNLFGQEPGSDSKGSLQSGDHFVIITYKKDILNWLNKCIKETMDFPMLRESIKQYIILLKKITNTMDDKEKQELNELMLRYFKESNYITENFLSLKAEIGEEVRKEVKELLEQKFVSDFNVYLGNNTNFQYSQIWIKFKTHDAASQFFGVESFSYKLGGALDVGIFNTGGKPIDYYHESAKGETPYWPYYKTIAEFEGFSPDFNNEKTLTRLYTDKEFRSRFVLHIINEIEAFINLHKVTLLEFLDKNEPNA